MKKRYILLNFKFSGFKNIENELEIQFSNRIFDDDINKSYVKAIYGTNGSGKSAIAHALEFYKNSVLNKNYLSYISMSKTYRPLINKKSKRLFADVYFASIDAKSNITNILHHIVDYEIVDDLITIKQEQLLLVKGKKWGSMTNEKEIFSVHNGEINNLNIKNDKLNNYLVVKSSNLLNNTSAINVFEPLLTSQSEIFYKLSKSDIDATQSIFLTMEFIKSLYVHIDFKDHSNTKYHNIANILNRTKQKNNKFYITGDEDDLIDKNLLDLYKNEIKKICNFIKVFKPELMDIKINQEPTDEKDVLSCKKILVYKNGNHISSKYESTGIKKLFELYAGLSFADDGGICFIDEFDANIHDVYLCKLVDYFATYSSGQLIFTTHNLGPMEVLSKKANKHVIDFLSNGVITSFSKNGNYSVVNLYRSGLIPNSPFNLDLSDFIKVFGDK